MRKEISKVIINGEEIGFRKATLYVGDNNGITTYILSLSDHRDLHGPFQDSKIDIVTKDNEKKTIIGTYEPFSKDIARIYILGEPFPITPEELEKFN